MQQPLRTRTTIWPIVAIAAFALAVPTSAGARGGGPKGEGGPSGAPKHGAHGQDAAPRRGHGKAKSRGVGQSKGKSRARGRSQGRPGQPPRRASEPRSAKRKSKPRGGRKGKVTICHATGSSTNPYVQITVSENAVKAHRAHQHGEDLIPAPQGGCPGGGKTEGQAAGEQAKAGSGPTAAGPSSGDQVAGTVAESAPGTTNPGGGGVRGVSADSGTRPKAAVAADGRESASGGSLPFTGFALIVLALIGAACLVGGTRLRSAQRRDA